MGLMARKTWQDDIQDSLARQLADLQREVSSLGRQVARYGGEAQNEVGDLGEALWHQGELVARQIGREATRLRRTAQEHPVPVVVGVVAIIGVLAALSLAMGRR